MKIALVGYGKMGKTIEQIALSRGHEIVSIIDINNPEDFQSDAFKSADVAIEFTTPAFNNYMKCFEAGVPVVSGTTGWLDRLGEIKQMCENEGKTFFYASNFSIGVNIFFAVPAEDKIATLEITTDAPEGSLVEDYKYYRRKLTALSFSSGNVARMPVLDFEKSVIETESAYKYVYGTANDGEGNLKSGNNTPVTLSENHASVGFVANNATQTRINVNYTVEPLNVGNARYAAFKSDIPYIIYNPGYGYSPVGNNIDTEKLTGINTDLRIGSQMWQGQYMMEATGRNTKITYSGEIDCGDHTYIRYYDLLGIWSITGNNNYYEPTTEATPRTTGTTAIISAMTYQDEDGNNIIAQDEDGKNYLKEPLSARMFWFGFFNSLDEMKAFAEAHE